MTNPIVVVNVSQSLPPAPSKLQRTGAFISQGGTTQTVGSLTLLTQISDLTSVLSTSKSLASLVWSASVVTGTTNSPHGWGIGDVVPVVVAGASPSSYNGTFNATITGTTTFTYALASNPGTETTPGSVILYSESELLSMATTFFAQGSGVSVYVLELGEGTPAEGVTALTTFINANTGKIYSYLVPEIWDADSTFVAFLGNYEATSTKTYFFVTTTITTYAAYGSTLKDVFMMVEAPAAPSTEFSCAAPFWVTLNYNPGSTNKVTPLAFAYLLGVTAYPTIGNSSLLTTLLANDVNYVGTGAEGGISNTILRNGHMADGNPFNYWYSIDNVQINIDLFLTNAVINGSNSPLAPLIYNQFGINTLQDVLVSVMTNEVIYGLAIGTVTQTTLPASVFSQNFQDGAYRGKLVINAEPFLVYTSENPSDFSIGKYGGFGVVYTPGRGFEQIIVDVIATNFV